jgi:hypothetical protein
MQDNSNVSSLPAQEQDLSPTMTPPQDNGIQSITELFQQHMQFQPASSDTPSPNNNTDPPLAEWSGLRFQIRVMGSYPAQWTSMYVLVNSNFYGKG